MAAFYGVFGTIDGGTEDGSAAASAARSAGGIRRGRPSAPMQATTHVECCEERVVAADPLIEPQRRAADLGDSRLDAQHIVEPRRQPDNRR